jgi:hypothetical protein
MFPRLRILSESDVFLRKTDSFMRVGPGFSSKVLVSNVEYELELGTSLCGFVLGTQKITSS